MTLRFPALWRCGDGPRGTGLTAAGISLVVLIVAAAALGLLQVRWAGAVPPALAVAFVALSMRQFAEVDAQRRQLKATQERLSLVVAGSNQGLWDWDMGSDMLFVSPRAQALFGMDVGEALRPRLEWLSLIETHPDEAPQVREGLFAHLRGHADDWDCEYRVRHGRGDWRWIRQRGLALRDESGRVHRVAGSVEDMTGSRHAEAERQRLEGRLRQAQKLEAIGTLAGGIAHDFNNILAAILGYGEMVQKDTQEGSPQRRRIDAAMSAAMRARSLVERILAFSRGGVGQRVPVHVQSVVGEALDTVAGSLPCGVRLERELMAGDAGLLGDPTQIHQVVMNLCANATQALRDAGTIRVRLAAVETGAPRDITTCLLPPGSYIELGVSDDGVGIAPRVLERIFDPFYTTKEIGVGTGLGLSLVHGIVTELGGGIDVRSELGQGTTLTIYLPWKCTTPAAREVEPAMPRGRGETVLLVDDEEALVRLGEETMAELGYEPVGFSSSLAALESVRSSPQRYELVVSDEAMPEMTGTELAAEIRRLRPDMPIVLMSGHVTAAMTRRARELRVAEVLSKPLVMSEIARALARALRR